MLTKLLINVGLISVPFAVWHGLDTRTPKMAVAAAFALAISLSAVFAGNLKPFKNKGILLFPIFLCLSLATGPQVSINGAPVNFWVWQPIIFVLLFCFMLFTISGLRLEQKDKDQILAVMMWTGAIMSVYVILQTFGFFQFFQLLKDYHEAVNNPQGRIVGTLGHPTIVAAFIAMIIPITLYHKKYHFSVIMVIAVLCTHSTMAIGAMIVSNLVWLVKLGRKWLCGALVAIFLVGAIGGIGYVKSPKIRHAFATASTGRTGQWPRIAKDIRGPSFITSDGKSDKGYPFTGHGLGSFKHLYTIKYRTPYNKAHNDYLQIAYETGLIGLALFLYAIWYMVAMNIPAILCGDRYRICLFSSFACIALIALGSFPWQMGALAYYTVVIAGLLHNQEDR